MSSILLLLVILLSHLENCKGIITTQPLDETVKKGKNHWFPCVADGIESDQSLQWFRNGKRLNEEPRITIENNESGTSSMLYITGIIPSDAGQYYCAVVKSSTDEKIASSRTATLVVKSLPSSQYPYCILETIPIIAGSNLKLLCLSEKVVPPVTLDWMYPIDIRYKNTQLMEDGKNISLELSMTAKKQYNGIVFSCKQESTLVQNNYTLCSVGPLDVLYKPDTAVQYASPALPGRETIVFCQTSSNPPVTSYRWLFDPQLSEDEYNIDESGQILKLLNPKIKQTGTNISCVATNEVGYGSSSVNLHVSYNQVDSEHGSTTGDENRNEFQSKERDIGLSLDVIIIIAAGVVIIIVLVVLVPVYHYCLCRNDNTIIVDSLGKEVTQPEVYYETREGVILRHTVQDRSLPRVPTTEVYGHWRHSTASQVPNDLESHCYTYIDTEND
ncbi:basigin-like [Antedon mediterranea]|uniref:basigin-like n=1 Tax=Antedon mediterranea TaxID=105859 RepID=UPI003AF844AE